MAREFELIDWIQAQQQNSPLVEVGIGDDMAVLRWPGEQLLLVACDQVLEGTHFVLGEHTPRQIGRKVMNRNLSDCAAMACLPAAAVVTVALPKGTPLATAQELYEGMRLAGQAFDCPIIGGDTASWEGKLAISLTILGKSAGIKPITRSGARPGDRIYVTGALGGSILGRHMEFVPRIEMARELAKTGAVTAMIDISDGLARDLRQICRNSGVGAVLEAGAIPVHADAATLAAKDGRDLLLHALGDGEDHELLLTAHAPLPPGLAVQIGRITAEQGMWLDYGLSREPVEDVGWEHGF